MFVFLTRLGRLAVGIPVVIAVTALLGFNTLTAVPVAHRQGASTMSCTVSSAGVGQKLIVAGHGFSAGTQYHLFVSSPTGSYETVANTDSTGAFTYESWTYAKGAYGASVWSVGGKSRQLATCTSLTL